MHKTFLLPLLLVLFPVLTYGQYHITGTVTDANHHPVPYANVVLLSPTDSSLVKGAMTDTTGYFQLQAIPAGRYRLKIRFIGFKPFQKTLQVKTNLDLDPIILTKNAQALDEVVVKADKPLIEQKVDRLVFNVSESIAAKDLNAFQTLALAPRVSTAGGRLQIIGKSGVKVMVNGRLLKMSSSGIQAYLKSLRSEDIISIEVITTPPSKFDAEGNFGVINIVLKKDPTLGFKGVASASYTQRSRSGGYGSVNLNYATKKLDISFNLMGGIQNKQPTSETTTIYPDSRRTTKSHREIEGKGIASSLSLNYALNEKSDLGIVVSGSNWDIPFVKNSLTQFSSTQVDSSVSSHVENKLNYQFLSVSPYYTIQLDTLGKELNIYFNYLTKHQDKNSLIDAQTEGTSYHKGFVKRLKNTVTADYAVYSPGFDVALPNQIMDLNFGGKMTFINNESDRKYFRNAYPNANLIQKTHDLFVIDQQIYALYLSLKKEFSEKWAFKAGLRYEYTQTEGHSVLVNKTNTRNFDGFFPTVYLRFSPDHDNSISLSYAKRIGRPDFMELNPFRFYDDFYSYSTGNPLLLPTYTHNVELKYNHNNFLFNAYYSHLNDGIGYIQFSSPNDYKVVSKPMNYYSQDSYGIYMSYRFRPFKWWISSNRFTGAYNVVTSAIPEITGARSRGYGASFRTRNIFVLNKKRTSFLTLYFSQDLPGQDGFLRTNSAALFRVGFRTSFLEHRLLLNVRLNDIFRQSRGGGEREYENFITRSKSYNDKRSLKVSLTYLFGNREAEITKKEIDQPNKNRM